MAKEAQCETHGTGAEALVCCHLAGDAAGLGFNRQDASADGPFPDAWCDDCEIVRAAHDGWSEEPEELMKLSLLCSGCYERARIRNTRTAITFDDLFELRRKCSSCEEWHYGAILDFGYDAPYYWRKEYENASAPGSSRKIFLNEDYCQVDDDYFVRGIVQLPIIGTSKAFCWGVWGSLCRANFGAVLEKTSEGINLPAMFSWLSTQISDYPDTLSLKMQTRIQRPGLRPIFELDPSEHPLCREYHEGITPQRVREITLKHVRSGE
jgi:hypothetical protein